MVSGEGVTARLGEVTGAMGLFVPGVGEVSVGEAEVLEEVGGSEGN